MIKHAKKNRADRGKYKTHFQYKFWDSLTYYAHQIAYTFMNNITNFTIPNNIKQDLN